MWGPRTFRDAELERKEEENMRVIIWLSSRPSEGEDLKKPSTRIQSSDEL